MKDSLLGPLITSKTRLKLLLRFFINPALDGYLQGLAKELEENTNSVRVELDRLESAGMLTSQSEGRRKLYQANMNHPLTSDLMSMLRKVTGVEDLIDRVVDRVGGLQQVWVTGKLAQGLESDAMEVVLVGDGFDMEYLSELFQKIGKHLKRTVHYMVTPSLSDSLSKESLLVWEKQVL